jgi:two-component system KDP operon response regulator KdpE
MTADPEVGPTSMIHVLVVDDEPHLLRALTMNLTGRGYRVSAASSGAGALELVARSRPDLLILDLGLPDMDGLQVIRSLRAREDNLPIVVLSARAGSAEKVSAFDLGANDYITKPFDMNELVARLRAAARRANISEPAAAVQLGPITVDLAARSIRRDDGNGASTVIHLTPTEWRMLEALLRRPGMLNTPTELLVAMRGDPEHTERSYLRIYMQQLRRKLEVDPSQPRYLLTEPGLGYRYQP